MQLKYFRLLCDVIGLPLLQITVINEACMRHEAKEFWTAELQAFSNFNLLLIFL
jgi:hypothetical protein